MKIVLKNLAVGFSLSGVVMVLILGFDIWNI